jgi:hypothetical protein
MTSHPYHRQWGGMLIPMLGATVSWKSSTAPALPLTKFIINYTNSYSWHIHKQTDMQTLLITKTRVHNSQAPVHCDIYFSFRVPTNTCGSNLLYVNLLAPTTWSGSWIFGKFVHPWIKNIFTPIFFCFLLVSTDRMFWLLPLKMLHDHTVYCVVHSDNVLGHLVPGIQITPVTFISQLYS